mmetsp:Transcript_7472/g.19291  ORF Transcript_7472/g.19291 Transcript_7472/m.19291 type:complete len:184 (-) Transcript_7472:24-575(-)
MLCTLFFISLLFNITEFRTISLISFVFSLVLSFFLLVVLYSNMLLYVSNLCISDCGSPLYMAPEVVGSKGAYTKREAEEMPRRKYDTKCDVWSAGIVMHALLTGSFPFVGDSQKGTLEAIVHSDLDLESPLVRALSSSCQHFLSTLLHRSPSSRPSAFEALSSSSWLLEHAEDRVHRHLINLT